MESGTANVSRILGVFSLMLSRMAMRLSFADSMLSILCCRTFIFCSKSYFFLAALSNDAYQALNFLIAVSMESSL